MVTQCLVWHWELLKKLGIILRSLHVLAPLILITTLWAGNYYYPCFIDEKRRFRTQAFRYQKPYIGTYGNDYYFSGVISFKITGYIHFLLD